MHLKVYRSLVRLLWMETEGKQQQQLQQQQQKEKEGEEEEEVEEVNIVRNCLNLSASS